MFNMGEKNFGQLWGKITNTKEGLWHSWINWMSVEEKLFFLNGLFNWNSINDILLGSVLNTNETKSEGNIFSFNHSFGTGTLVHNINFGDDTDGSNTFWIDLSCHLKTIRCGHIDVSWEYAQNDSSWIIYISVSHRSSNLFNVIWLIWTCHRNTSNSRKIYKCKIRAGWRENM